MSKYGNRSVKEVTKIEPENNLIHAIGYDETSMRTYTYETLIVGGDYAQQVLTEPRSTNKLSTYLRNNAFSPFFHRKKCHRHFRFYEKSKMKVLALVTPEPEVERYLDMLRFLQELVTLTKY